MKVSHDNQIDTEHNWKYHKIYCICFLVSMRGIAWQGGTALCSVLIRLFLLLTTSRDS